MGHTLKEGATAGEDRRAYRDARLGRLREDRRIEPSRVTMERELLRPRCAATWQAGNTL